MKHSNKRNNDERWKSKPLGTRYNGTMPPDKIRVIASCSVGTVRAWVIPDVISTHTIHSPNGRCHWRWTIETNPRFQQPFTMNTFVQDLCHIWLKTCITEWILSYSLVWVNHHSLINLLSNKDTGQQYCCVMLLTICLNKFSQIWNILWVARNFTYVLQNLDSKYSRYKHRDSEYSKDKHLDSE